MKGNKFMRKKPKNFKTRLSSLIFSVVCLTVITTLGFSTVQEISESAKLRGQLKSAKIELKQLTKNKEDLLLERKRLTDPAYIENYARGTHRLSKEDEQVFILPKGDN